jgi:hypothetical protein
MGIHELRKFSKTPVESVHLHEKKILKEKVWNWKTQVHVPALSLMPQVSLGKPFHTSERLWLSQQGERYHPRFSDEHMG